MKQGRLRRNLKIYLTSPFSLHFIGFEPFLTMASNKEAAAASTPYADQAPVNYSDSQAATTYAGSDAGQYPRSTASVYSSSTVLSEGDRLVRREGGRVSFPDIILLTLNLGSKDFNIMNELYPMPAGLSVPLSLQSND